MENSKLGKQFAETYFVQKEDSSNWQNISQKAETIMMNCKNLNIAVGAFARVLAAMASGADHRRIIKLHPTAMERMAAYKLLLIIASRHTQKPFQDQKLISLAPSYKKGLFLTCGRFPAKIASKTFGSPNIPIIMHNSPLARLIVWDAHNQCHRRDIPAVLAHTRRTAWIIKGRTLVKSIIKACMKCRKTSMKLQNQIMADLPEEVLEEARPFQLVGLDLFGPVFVKGLGGSKENNLRSGDWFTPV